MDILKKYPNPLNQIVTEKTNPHTGLWSEVGFELGSTEVKGMQGINH